VTQWSLSEVQKGTCQQEKFWTGAFKIKIMKRVKIIEQLPTRDQNAVFHFINSLVEKNKLKGKL